MATQRFHGVMKGLLAGMRRERPVESSIAAHLLDIKDPDTGALILQAYTLHIQFRTLVSFGLPIWLPICKAISKE